MIIENWKVVWFVTLHSLGEYRTRKWQLLQILLQPLLFAVTALLLFRGSSKEGEVIYTLIGSGIMGMWATTLTGAGSSIEFERRQGLLEYLMTTSSSLQWIILGKSVAHSLIGLITYLFLFPLQFLFDIPVQIHLSFSMLFILLLIALSFVAMGQLLAFLFVFSRNANPISNALSRSLYVLSGLIFPISMLPGPCKVVSYVIPCSYGMVALRTVNESGWTESVWWDVAMMSGLILAFFAIARMLYGLVEYWARVRGDLGGV